MLRLGCGKLGNVVLYLIPTVHNRKMTQFSEIANHAWKMGGGGEEKVDEMLFFSTSINEQKLCHDVTTLQ